jgi:hypothetical protein
MDRTAYAVPLFLLLGACGNGNDTIWTGFSGVVIFGIIALVVLHYLKKGKK